MHSLFPVATGSVTNSEIGSWMIIFAFVLGVIALIVKLFVRKPPIEAEFATKAEVNNLSTKFTADVAKLEGKIDAQRMEIKSDYLRVEDMIQNAFAKIDKSDEARSSSIHNRLNMIGDRVSELSGSVKSLPCNNGSTHQQHGGCPR